MKALVSLCFLALALVCQGTPLSLQQSSLSSLQEGQNRRLLSSLDGLQLSRRQLNSLEALLQNRRQQMNLLQGLNMNPLLSNLELNSQNLQQLRRHLSSVEVNSRENPPPDVHTRIYDFGLG